MRKLVYYIAASIDGYIADPAGDTSVFPVHQPTLDDLYARYPETCPQHLRESLGVTASNRRFDTVILGRHTHAPALQAGLTSAYPHLRQLVVTHGDLPEDSTVQATLPDNSYLRSTRSSSRSTRSRWAAAYPCSAPQHLAHGIWKTQNRSPAASFS